MDFDADGDDDVLSGSFPGALYLFRRNDDGAFAEGETLKHQGGKEINTGSASTAFAVDWDSDGDLDLVTGNISGDVHLVSNTDSRTEPAYSEPVQLDTGDILKNRGGDSGPVVADWDGDGRHDVLVGMGDGSVVWFRNAGTKEEPQRGPGEEIVPKSPFGFNLVNARPDKGEWGARVKIHVVDFNGDGRVDLLLGDRSGGPAPPVELTAEQQAAIADAKERLVKLRPSRSAARVLLRKLEREAEKDPSQQKALDAAREKAESLEREYVTLVQTIRQGEPQPVRHGFLWLFERSVPETVTGR
ncbi:MAG: VCBS repeat-containing protein [Planctomycetes bacterium]|nr:VCBS repeat-containing protein [Planctomycetota bacterium]